MTGMDQMAHFAALIKERNIVAARIAGVLGRPALSGHFGEYVAAEIFDIDLHGQATAKGSDGRFASGPLTGKTVEIKYYPKNEGLLDMKVGSYPDYYLVLTGPRAPADSSRGKTRPWVIEAVYLFDAANLASDLRGRNVKIGTASSVRRKLWDAAAVYPRSGNDTLALTKDQRGLLALFRE